MQEKDSLCMDSGPLRVNTVLCHFTLYSLLVIIIIVIVIIIIIIVITIIIFAAVTAAPVTSSSAVVQLVAGTTEEFCEATMYCEFNVSAVVGVQLQVNSSSGEWRTLCHFNATANNQSSVSAAITQLAVSYSYAVIESYRSQQHVACRTSRQIGKSQTDQNAKFEATIAIS